MSALSRVRLPGAMRIPRVRVRSRPRLIAILAVLLVLLVLLGGGWLWFRDSPLVAVQRVSVVGLSGPDAQAIRSALTARARTMSTLDVSTGDLMASVAPYPVVKGIEVSTQFPHGMRIVVHEQMPVGAVMVGGRAVPVANDGTILRDGASVPGLPLIMLSAPPGGNTISDPAGVAAVALLAAAPQPILGRLASVQETPAQGLVARLKQGPRLIFGGSDQLIAKWSAAMAVLADHGSAGAAYIDVSDPGRPAAGGGAGADAAVNAALAASSFTGTSGSSSAPAASATGTSTSAGSASAGSASAGSTSAGSAATSSSGAAPASGTSGPASGGAGSAAPSSTSGSASASGGAGSAAPSGTSGAGTSGSAAGGGGSGGGAGSGGG